MSSTECIYCGQYDDECCCSTTMCDGCDKPEYSCFCNYKDSNLCCHCEENINNCLCYQKKDICERCCEESINCECHKFDDNCSLSEDEYDE